MNDRDRDELLSMVTDRFERRLAEECGKLRTEVGDLRVDTMNQFADVRREIGEVRLDIGRCRLDLSEQFGSFRVAAEARHNELLKWAFIFWLGQAIAITSAFAALK